MVRGVIKCINCGKHFDKESGLSIHYNRNTECFKKFWNKIVIRKEDKWK